MVALSLYKGNLHRVPETPRRWLMPTPKISLKDFRCLLRRRSRALSRLPTPPDVSPTTATASNPNPNLKTDTKSKPEEEVPVSVPVKTEKEEEDVRVENVEVPEKLVDSSAVVVEPKLEVLENDQKLLVPMNPSGLETINKEDGTDNQKKKEIEDKLQVLNMKKHGLVQLLKQILNAEEELKRRSMQGMAVRPSLPLQVDTTNDTGSITKLNTPRMGSDGNPIGEVDGDGGDDASNQNTLSRNLLRMSSTSPSSDSQLRKTPYNVFQRLYDVWRLESRGIYLDYIRAIKYMYYGAKTRARTVGGDSDHFSVVMGLHQGSTHGISICFGDGCTNTTYPRKSAMVYALCR